MLQRRYEHPLDLGLVVLWNADEPATTGAYLPIEARARRTYVLGRGTPLSLSDDYTRLVMVRQSPYGNEPLPPFESPSLSRSQLLIRIVCAPRLELVNLGRRRLFVNGRPAEKHSIQAGDIVELGGQLTLLCCERPRRFNRSGCTVRHPFGQPDLHGFVGESPRAWKLRDDIAFVARRPGHVLLLGDTGTGKELAAKALHALSGRNGPLVARNAATIPDSLIDAELFGNMKGYPNPGMPDRKGLFGAAHTGTLFLDEFGDLPSAAQAHVLRVLDSGEYQRLGEDAARRSDVRLIGATNHAESTLRPDVAARFEFRLYTPALHERREDIPLLARHLLLCMKGEDESLARFFDADGWPRFSAGFVRMLVQQPPVGNVRGLRNLLWSAVASSRGDHLEWPDCIASELAKSTPDAAIVANRDDLQRALDSNNGSIEKTWRALGFSSRHVLARLVKKYGLSVTKQVRET